MANTFHPFPKPAIESTAEEILRYKKTDIYTSLVHILNPNTPKDFRLCILLATKYATSVKPVYHDPQRYVQLPYKPKYKTSSTYTKKRTYLTASQAKAMDILM